MLSQSTSSTSGQRRAINRYAKPWAVLAYLEEQTVTPAGPSVIGGGEVKNGCWHKLWMALYWVKVRGAGLAKNSAAQCSIAIPATFDLLLLQVLVGRRLKAEKRQSSRLLMGTGAGWRFCGTSVFFQYLFDFSVLLLFFFEHPFDAVSTAYVTRRYTTLC